MVLGVLLGAWLMDRHRSWQGIWIAVATLMVLEVLDALYGAGIGRSLGEATRDLFTGGAAS
ncbi:hypothetical protein [Salipiger mucosus]|uniref:Uncharacterized protein n=1 Tax=Salipiger mucosus DSM 16094 TaxID=1123237 RepID=S9QTT5_9RHOB|nr:hypothetical protein [Salipiger mucosus]EPX84781.1 hypothetical protein Salmuc_01354 [Salipiger mucosus DSM 16094]